MIEVIIDDEGWRRDLPEAEALAADCADATGKYEPAVKKEMALLLTNDAAIKALNARFRNLDQPTNVLAFPSGDDNRFLGDIALARETCLREAAGKKITLRDHAAHLIIYAMLHLVGYDHQADDEASVMEQREAKILKAIGIANPYTDALETI